MKLKRLWDTTTKQMVFAKWPTGHECQVWTDEEGSKLYIYDMAQWLEYTPWVSNAGKTYWPQWKAIDWDDEVGFYDTNEPTELYAWESGDEATYTFKDYDGTVLKTGKVKEGTAPTPPADPTRTGYTFTWWNPTVWKITKKTTYTAQYTINKYTITATSSDADLWTVSPASVANVEYGTALTVADNVITVGTGTSAPTITATAGEWNTFEGWWTVPATVTGNTSVEATFQSAVVMRTVTFSLSNVVWDENEWEEWAFVPAESQDPLWWTISPQSIQVPDGFTFALDGSNLIFYSPDGSSSDDDAVAVTVTVDDTMGTNMVWDLWDWLDEVSWIGMVDDRFVVTWDVSAFPIVFFDDAE